MTMIEPVPFIPAEQAEPLVTFNREDSTYIIRPDAAEFFMHAITLQLRQQEELEGKEPQITPTRMEDGTVHLTKQAGRTALHGLHLIYEGHRKRYGEHHPKVDRINFLTFRLATEMLTHDGLDIDG